MSRLIEVPYDRAAAVAYANQWAYKRNPKFYDFENIGGDCTNYASQCVYAGCGIMNYTKTYGWYYISIDDRAPAWTSVEYFYKFMTTNKQQGPYGIDASIREVEIGDLVQLRFGSKEVFGHTPVIVEIRGEKIPSNIYVAAHSYDVNCRPLSTYRNVSEIRFIHILGARKEVED